MLEVRAAIAILDDFGHVKAFSNRTLKCFDVDVVAPVDFMPLDVEQSSTHELGGHETLVKLRRLDELVDKSLRNHLASLVVLSIVLKHLGNKHPVLINL